MPLNTSWMSRNAERHATELAELVAAAGTLGMAYIPWQDLAAQADAMTVHLNPTEGDPLPTTEEQAQAAEAHHDQLRQIHRATGRIGWNTNQYGRLTEQARYLADWFRKMVPEPEVPLDEPAP